MGIIMTTRELRPRDKADHYPTPRELCKAAVAVIPEIEGINLVLDPGAGEGVWGKAVRQRWYDARLVGVEMDEKHPWDTWYRHWFVQDYLETDFTPNSFDLVIGNPPYGCNANGVKDRKLAEKFVRKSWEYVREGGYIVFLLRLAFLEGQKRIKEFWPYYPLKDIYALSRRPSFTGNARTDATAYGLFVWQKGYTGPCYMKWLTWDYDTSDNVSGYTDSASVYQGLGASSSIDEETSRSTVT